MNQEERMKANLPYKAWLDGLAEKRMECKKKIKKYNDLEPDDEKGREELLRSILGKAGKGLIIEQPFRCDYGKNIFVGDNFWVNYNLTVLDVGRVTVGDNVLIAPNVSIYTAGHPIHPDSRNSGYEYGIDVSIGSNCWIGGSTVICPGVHIGDNVVIGAGSVVTKDIPSNVVAVGNPCKVLREITEDDRHFYFKDRKFDVDDYFTPVNMADLT